MKVDKTLVKSLLSIVWIVALFFGSHSMAIDLDLGNSFDYYFDNLESNYSELYFNQGGNNFEWVIFWQGSHALTNDVTIDLTSGSGSIDCKRQVEWIYYNPQRGNSMWPLDTGSLDHLKNINTSYNDVTVTWGRYTDCSGKNVNDVYGQVINTLGSATYKLVVGVKFPVNSNLYIQQFDNSLQYFESSGSAEGKIFDSRWGVAEIIEHTSGLNNFSMAMINNAELDTFYKSDPVLITGLVESQQVLASITKWSLFINEIMVGTTGYVHNGDQVQIELKSDNSYNSVVSSTLSIQNKQATFYITTQPEWYDASCDLSISEKLRTYSIFQLLIDAYKDNPIKLKSFLYTFKSMLSDKVSQEWACGQYAYLLDVTEAYMMDELGTGDYNDNQGMYTAPNCKVYELKYDDARQAYYSPDFITIHYFISTESLEKFVDKYNPWKGNCGENYNDPWDWKRRIAPNGKVYVIKKSGSKYTSDDFMYSKIFDTLQAIRKYIDINNPAILVWKHELDNTFDPVVYIAPNKKEYTIQRVFVSAQEKYMSYKFITPKYFDNLDQIEAFIDKNNPA